MKIYISFKKVGIFNIKIIYYKIDIKVLFFSTLFSIKNNFKIVIFISNNICSKFYIIYLAFFYFPNLG